MHRLQYNLEIVVVFTCISNVYYCHCRIYFYEVFFSKKLEKNMRLSEFSVLKQYPCFFDL